MMTIALSALMLLWCVNAIAAETSPEMLALQHQAARVESQITQAQTQCSSALQDQVKPLKSSIENLVKEKVRIDQHIAQLEAQIDGITQGQAASCGRQVRQYNDELTTIKQQMAGLAAKKAIQPPQQAAVPAKQPQAAATVPAPAKQPQAAATVPVPPKAQ